MDNQKFLNQINKLLLNNQVQEATNLVFNLDSQENEELQSCFPIHIAAQKGYVDVINFFLRAGWNVDCHNNLKETPLMIACRFGQTEIAEILIEHGADVHAVSKLNNVAIEYAVSFEHIDCIRVLGNHGANLNIRDNLGRTGLFLAAPRQVAVLKTLLEYDVDTEIPDYRGMTPLMLAASENYYEAAAALLSHGASMDASDQQGRTPLQVARGDVRDLMLAVQEKKALSSLCEPDHDVSFSDSDRGLSL